MKKKLISLLVAICLVIGLLPVASIAEYAEPKTASVKIMNTTTLAVTEGGVAQYAKSVSGTAYNAAGEEIGLYWKSDAGTEDSWNVKFEYPMGGIPTLTFKDATFDYYDDAGNIMYTKADGTSVLKYTQAAIYPNSSVITDLKIVLQGTNHIDVGYGIFRPNDKCGNVTVVGEPGNSLSGTVRNIGAFSLQDGYDLTLENANLNISSASVCPLGTTNGNLTINGGSIKVNNSGNYCIRSETGDITINDAEIEVTNTFRSATSGSGAIHATDGRITITNSTINGVSTNGLVLHGKDGITITGGTYNLIGGNYAVVSPIKINGGEIEASGGSRAFKTDPDLSSYANCDIKAGASKAAATLRETVPDGAKYVYVGPHTHVWGEAEAVTADCAGASATKRTCTVCEAVEAYTEAAGTGAHNAVTDAAVPATCYLPGLTEGSHCGDCGVVIVEQKIVLPTGHTNLQDAVLTVFSDRYIYTVHCGDCGDTVSRRTVPYQSTEHPVDKLTVETKDATCEEEGHQNITVSCKNCTESIATHTIILPKNPSAHTNALTAHPFVAPDYNNDGNIAYWSCGDCGKCFADAAGTQQLEENGWILYKLCNHTGGTATCYAKATCTLCGRPYGKFADHTPDADDGDCTTPILCSVPECRVVTTAGSIHTGGTATCIALAKCENCGKEYGKYASHTGGTATCHELAKCTVCGERYGAYTKHISNPDDGNLETPVTCSICAQELGLPVEGGAIIGSPDIRYGSSNLQLTHYNEPKYLISTSFTTECVDGMEFTAWGATTSGANEDNYNLKFYWNAGDPNPTIILRGYKWDVYNDESGKIQSKKDADTGEYTGKAIDAQYPMLLLNDLAYDIILTGEDSTIGGHFGIHYTGDLSIKSEGNTKLTIDSMTGCISRYASSDAGTGVGDSVTIDANLSLTSHGYYSSGFGRGMISTDGGDLIINGGNIICDSTHTSQLGGLVAAGGGNLIINGGKIWAKSVAGANSSSGAIQSIEGKVIINGGTVEPVPTSNQGIYGMTGIEINGGTVKFYAPRKGLSVGSDADISITGGLVEIISEKGAFTKMPILGEGITGYAGTDIRMTAAYDNEKNYSSKYVKIGLNVTAPNPANGPTLPGTDPNNPGESPAAPSIEPTASPTAAPGMKLPKAVAVKVGGVDMRITKYDTPIYVVNTPVEYRDTSTQDGDNVIPGNLFQGMTPTITTDENNWNAMLVWKSTEGIPTLYLDGLIIDDYNEEAEKWRAYQNNPTQEAYTTAITTASGQYMRIVLTGEDSQFKTRHGISFASKLRLESEGDTKLNMWCMNGTLYGAEGMPLVVNANIDAIVHRYVSSSSSHVMMTRKADLTINGGNINLDALGERVTAIYAYEGGNVTINGGNITARGTWGTAPGSGTIDSWDKIIINGGTLNITAAYAVCMHADKGIDINGGIINLSSPWYVINAGADVTSPANITFNGGTTTMVGQYAIYNSYAVPVIGAGVYAYVGAGPRSAQAFDGTDTKLMKKPWMFVTDDESKKIDLDKDDEELEDDELFEPTEAPTESTAPTTSDSTVDPTATEATIPEDNTPEGTAPEDDFNEDEESDDGYYDYDITPNLNISEGISEEIPDALYDMGIDSADMIRDILVEMIWAVDDYSDMFAFFDITLMYYDGEDWVVADEEHYPENGYITAMLPYPEGTGMDTPFTAVHMYSSDAFGLTPGEVELLTPINTEDGILVELTGLSPVAIAWEGLAEDNFETGDTGVGLYVGLMVVAVLGMAGTVMLGNNKKKRKA